MPRDRRRGAASTDPEYATAQARSKNRDALNVEIERYLAGGTSAEWVERLNAAEVPCGPIYAINEIFADPQVKHLDMVQDIETPDKRGTLHMVGQPVTLSRTPSRLVAAAARARRAHRGGAARVRLLGCRDRRACARPR